MKRLSKKRGTVALIMGGEGAEHKVSLEGAKYVLELMTQGGYDVLPLRIAQDGGWYLEDGGEDAPAYPVRLAAERGILVRGKIIPCRVAFPLLHGNMGEDGVIQGALTAAGIPYVGARVSAGALTSDKIRTKLVAEALGIPTVPWISVGTADGEAAARELAERGLGYPMFIKPPELGSSIGAHPVRCAEEFSAAYRDAAQYGERLLIERLLDGIREIEVAFFEGRQPVRRIISHPGEVVSRGFYDYEEKYSDASHARIYTRARLTHGVADRIRDYADRLAHECGLRQLGRIDFFLLGEDIYFNEINSMPGFTAASLYPRMIDSEGLSPICLISHLLEDAAEGRL